MKRSLSILCCILSSVFIFSGCSVSSFSESESDSKITGPWVDWKMSHISFEEFDCFVDELQSEHEFHIVTLNFGNADSLEYSFKGGVIHLETEEKMFSSPEEYEFSFAFTKVLNSQEHPIQERYYVIEGRSEPFFYISDISTGSLSMEFVREQNGVYKYSVKNADMEVMTFSIFLVKMEDSILPEILSEIQQSFIVL